MGEALASLEASASGADGQWRTLAALSTPGPVTVSTGFNVTLPAFGGDGAARWSGLSARERCERQPLHRRARRRVLRPALPTFGDIAGHPARREAEAIRQMAARGVIKGYNDGNFGGLPGTPR